MLQTLLSEGRISIAELAQRVNVSRANAYDRLGRLHRRGVIKGFTVEIDSVRLGLGVSAVVLISVGNRQELAAATHVIRDMPEVEFAAIVTGQFDVLILVRVRDIPALRTFIIDRLQAIPTLQQTITSLVLDDILKRPAVLPESAQ